MRAIFISNEGQVRIPWRILALVVFLVAILFAVNVGWRAAGLPGQQSASELQFFFFTLLIAGPALLLIIGLLRIFEKRRLDAIWLSFDRSAVTQTLLGSLLGCVAILLLVLAARLGGYGSFAPGSFTLSTLLSAMLPTLAAVFLLAAWEEFTLRGYLFRQVALIRQNPMSAAIVMGILFGVLHSGNPGANWQGLLFTAIGGFLMGVLLIRSGSLWLVVGYHFGWNACSGNLFGLTVSGTDLGMSVWATTLSGSDWLTGGSYGFESSVPALIAEVVTLGGAVLVLTKRGRGRFEL